MSDEPSKPVKPVKPKRKKPRTAAELRAHKTGRDMVLESVGIDPAAHDAASKAETPAVMGRPSDYDPEFCLQLVEHMKNGKSFESFGAAIGLAPRTLYGWLIKYPDFLRAREVGRQLSKEWWVKAAQDNLVLNKNYHFNAQVWQFCMKNLHNWSDKTETTLIEKKEKYESPDTFTDGGDVAGEPGDLDDNGGNV